MQGVKSFFQMLWNTLKKVGNYIKPYLHKVAEWRRRVWKKYQINKILLLLVLVTVLVTTVYLFILAKSTDVGSLEEDLAERTMIYDKDGELAGTLYGEKGNNVPFDQISDNIKNAVISTEDKRFYEHHGFDIIGIGRAFVKLIVNRGISGGGSTITQQLAKNAYLTQKPTFDRKARELFLAIEIEKEYDKDQILTMYLNNAYLGNGVWGVQDASERYFGKSASEVSVSEAAMLIGMLKGPSIYNPIDDYDAAIERRNIVIGLMLENGKIDAATADAAKAEAPVLVNNYQEPESGYKYPYFFDEVIKEATEAYGIKEDDILKKGYKIYTTLDQNYQAALDTTFSDDSLFPEASVDGALVQAGSSVIDPKTGAVYALIGGRGDHTYRGFNRATDTKLPPGSTMKPLSVYTPALEAGYTPNSILQDEPLSYYDVKNYDGIYSGSVPMYQAVAESKNAPAVWLLNEIGINKGAKKVEKFGIQLDKEDYYLGLALGGLTKGISPLQLASAYSVFANSGYRQESYLITRIEDASGKVIAEHKASKSTRVTTPEVVNEMTSMLQTVFNTGTGATAKPYGFNIAGKTGTTENVNTETEAKDQWIVGYTPDVVIATWIGFDMSSDTHYLTAGDIAPVFKDEAQRVLSVSPQTPFSVADASTGVTNDTTSDERQDELNQTLKDIGSKVKEESSNLGGKLKEGASKVKNKLSSWIQEWQNSR